MKLFFNLLFIVLLSACTEYRPEEPKENTFKKEENSQVTQSSAKEDFWRFEGRIPGDNCNYIQQNLILKGDSSGVFRLKETYVGRIEDGDVEIVSSGEWKWMVNKNKSMNLLLSKGTFKDTLHRSVFSFQKNKIKTFLLDNDTIFEPEKYTLYLTKKVVK